ncbi:hypothetical protein C7457_0588 [Thermovibrio guaymasensis]|uniref:DUF2905 family protein n=1 Tax=Thermovibrio guaymasensis TaxID=240167 RepID=A0A420W8W2_9BACT|nr:DUF2905 domain-containing protein [Thermovibrio guaymasensis]RKQ63708.1 hypothetical protein C7457_0588 [Thermovibrio guaymasensis]
MVEDLGKLLILTGLFLVVLGALILILSKLGNIPVGKLPGDIVIKRDNIVFYFPLGTSILISLILTLVSFILFIAMRKQ